jgi:Mg2+/citrate symporter
MYACMHVIYACVYGTVCMYVCMLSQHMYLFISLNNLDVKSHTKLEFQNIVQEKTALKHVQFERYKIFASILY